MKKYAIGFIFGAIIFSIIRVYATVTYSANQITYTKGNNTMYLSEAIDELYTSADRVPTIGVATYANSAGSQQASGTRKVTMNLNKGRYLVHIMLSLGISSTTSDDRGNTCSGNDDLTCTNNCQVTRKDCYYRSFTASGTTHGQAVVNIVSYIVNVTADNTTITGANSSWGRSTNSSVAEIITISATPISK